VRTININAKVKMKTSRGRYCGKPEKKRGGASARGGKKRWGRFVVKGVFGGVKTLAEVRTRGLRQW